MAGWVNDGQRVVMDSSEGSRCMVVIPHSLTLESFQWALHISGGRWEWKPYTSGCHTEPLSKTHPGYLGDAAKDSSQFRSLIRRWGNSVGSCWKVRQHSLCSFAGTLRLIILSPGNTVQCLKDIFHYKWEGTTSIQSGLLLGIQQGTGWYPTTRNNLAPKYQ